MNIATVVGFVTGLSILVWAVFASTETVEVFVNLPSLAIVLGGTLAATFICYPLREVARIFTVFLAALKAEEPPIPHAIEEIVAMAGSVSKKGEAYLKQVHDGTDNDFLKSGLQMLIDGYTRDEIKEILDNRIGQYYEQEMAAAGVFRTMSKLSPAFGIIGTLIGLVAMMQSMGDDVSKIGGGMATALITTLYGAFFANMVFLPIAIKVEKRIEGIATLMTVVRDGILFIQEKTPASIIFDKLQGYLPPSRWSSIGRPPAGK